MVWQLGQEVLVTWHPQTGSRESAQLASSSVLSPGPSPCSGAAHIQVSLSSSVRPL